MGIEERHEHRRTAGAALVTFAARVERVRARMEEFGVDVLLLSAGPDLPYLTGYEAMPLERLTMLVVPATGRATLLVPRLEAAPARACSGVVGGYMDVETWYHLQVFIPLLQQFLPDDPVKGAPWIRLPGRMTVVVN